MRSAERITGVKRDVRFFEAKNAHNEIVKMMASGHNFTETADKLGLDYQGMWRYCLKMGIDRVVK